MATPAKVAPAKKIVKAGYDITNRYLSDGKPKGKYRQNTETKQFADALERHAKLIKILGKHRYPESLHDIVSNGNDGKPAISITHFIAPQFNPDSVKIPGITFEKGFYSGLRHDAFVEYPLEATIAALEKGSVKLPEKHDLLAVLDGRWTHKRSDEIRERAKRLGKYLIDQAKLKAYAKKSAKP